MTSFRQIEVNRRNAQLSTGPVTEEAKKRSRQSAVLRGLTRPGRCRRLCGLRDSRPRHAKSDGSFRSHASSRWLQRAADVGATLPCGRISRRLTLCSLFPRKLPLVGRVVRLIDGELVHCRLPEMFGEPGRTEIELALRNPFGEDAV
jgi:hypothetical protein